MCVKGVVLVYLIGLPFVNAQDASDDFGKAFITLGVLCAAGLISLIVAKILDHCYDRSTLRDDASDISEHTRKLIRDRLVVMKFPKRVTAKETIMNAQRASRVIRIWSAKSKKHHSDKKSVNNDIVIDVDKEKEKQLTVSHVDIEGTQINLSSINRLENSTTNNSAFVTLQIPKEEELLALQVSSSEHSEGTKQTIATESTTDVSSVSPNTTKSSSIHIKQDPNQSIQSQSPIKVSVSQNDVCKSKSFHKSQSVPQIITYLGEVTRSSSPPKILIKQPTANDLNENMAKSECVGLSAVFENVNSSVNSRTSQPVAVQTPTEPMKESAYVKSARTRVTSSKSASAKSRIVSAPKLPVLQASGDSDNKKMVHFRNDTKTKRK